MRVAAQGELRGAAHVDVFGCKQEGSTVSLWVRDSADATLLGAPLDSYTALQVSGGWRMQCHVTGIEY